MVLAAAVCSIVMAGLFSAMLMAARVAEAPYKRSALDVHALVDRLRIDAAAATAVSQLSSSAIMMIVPDRNGDGTPETIAYDWSQAAGVSKAITRTENGVTESASVVASTFAVSADIDQTTTSDTTESSEQLLFSRTPLLPIAYSIKSNQWMGQFVVPALPSNALSWRVTRVRFPARQKAGTPGQIRVQVRLHNNGLPRAVVDEGLLLEASLPVAFATQEMSFSRANGLPVSGACIVWQWVKDPEAGELQYETLASALAAGQRVTSTDSGASWSANTLQAVALDVYGTYTLPAGVTVKKLRTLTITMKADSTLSGSTATTIRFPNLPQVSG